MNCFGRRSTPTTTAELDPRCQVFRDEWGGIVASLIGFLGDFDLADVSAQEAFAIAAERWPRDGLPRNPRGWLLVTARNRAVDRITACSSLPT